MFENLSGKLQSIFSSFRDKELTTDNMQDALREIRRALLDADVNLRVVKSFIASVRDKAEGQNIVEGVNPSQQLIKIVHDELVNILGGEAKTIELTSKPSLIMMLGLQGSGKTTSSAKLAMKLKQEGKQPLLVACDVYRPAAISQLKTLASDAEIEIFSLENSTDVQKIVEGAKNYAISNGLNPLILDTAGRLQIDTEMMAELLLLDRIFKPDEKLLVIDAMVGQESVSVAENFDAQLGLTGLVLTKLDGDARGGAALSVVHCTGKPIKFTGTGEKLNALEDFHPDRMATRILGMGDVVTLVEKAQSVFDEKQAAELEEKLAKSEFSFNDFLKLQKQMSKLGSFGNVLGMIPGLNISQDQSQLLTHASEKEFKKFEVFIQSMTPAERANPKLIDTSRKKRISKGCGINLAEINQYMTQFEQMRTMMTSMSDMKKMFGKIGGMPSGMPDMTKMMSAMKGMKGAQQLMGYKGKLGNHALNKAKSMMRKFK